MCLGDFNGHVGQSGVEGRLLLEICLVKELCVSHIWFKRERHSTFRMVENDTEIVFVLIRKEHHWFMGSVKSIPGEFQHAHQW